MEEIVDTLVVTIPRYLHKEPECVAAKEKELKNWEDFEVYMDVEDVGQRTINTTISDIIFGTVPHLCVKSTNHK